MVDPVGPQEPPALLRSAYRKRYTKQRGSLLWTTGTPPQHRVPHNIKWTSFAPPGWTNFAPPLTVLSVWPEAAIRVAQSRTPSLSAFLRDLCCPIVRPFLRLLEFVERCQGRVGCLAQFGRQEIAAYTLDDIVKLIDCRLFSAFLHEAKLLKLTLPMTNCANWTSFALWAAPGQKLFCTMR